MKKLRNLSIQTHKVISFAVMIGGSFLCLLFSEFSMDIAMIISFALVIVGIVWHISFVKCPHCGHCFGFREFVSIYCPECGKKVK